jgi:hypothetical protein
MRACGFSVKPLRKEKRMLNRPLVITICVMTSIALATVSRSVTAKPACRTVHGHLDSLAADLDNNPDTLETVGTLRGGIHADFEFSGFTPVPSGALPSVQFYTATSEYTLRDGTIVTGINTGVFDGSTGEVTEFTTFFAKDNMEIELGRIIVSGAFDLMAGVGKSRYRGHVCF